MDPACSPRHAHWHSVSFGFQGASDSALSELSGSKAIPQREHIGDGVPVEDTVKDSLTSAACPNDRSPSKLGLGLGDGSVVCETCCFAAGVG